MSMSGVQRKSNRWDCGFVGNFLLIDSSGDSWDDSRTDVQRKLSSRLRFWQKMFASATVSASEAQRPVETTEC